MFQFLIGTVKTFFKNSYLFLFLFVSIPHRYCKNLKTGKLYKIERVVSIPHRYCKNPIVIENQERKIKSFNSS